MDLGCGTGAILEFLPRLEYHGIDSNPRYLESAGRKYGSRGAFVRADLGDARWPVNGPFDRALAAGLLHHLPDAEALRVLEQARALLKRGGTLVSIDGCYEDGQSPVARALLSMDRGRFVRRQAEYEALARRVFKRLSSHVERNLLRLPYTHLIMEMAVE